MKKISIILILITKVFICQNASAEWYVNFIKPTCIPELNYAEINSFGVWESSFAIAKELDKYTEYEETNAIHNVAKKLGLFVEDKDQAISCDINGKKVQFIIKKTPLNEAGKCVRSSEVKIKEDNLTILEFKTDCSNPVESIGWGDYRLKYCLYKGCAYENNVNILRKTALEGKHKIITYLGEK